MESRTVRDWIEQLVGQGFLEKTGEFNVLQVTESGQRLLKREVEPQLLRPAEKQTRVAKCRGGFLGRRRPRTVRCAAPVAERKGNAAKRTGLRRLRRRGASRHGSSSSVDARTDFAACKGVGEKKLADYGPDFLDAINGYCAAAAAVSGCRSDDASPPVPSPPAAALMRPRSPRSSSFGKAQPSKRSPSA